MCLRTTGGEMFCVGKNEHGQLGDGTYNDSDDWVTPIIPSGRSVVDISCGITTVLDDPSLVFVPVSNKEGHSDTMNRC